MLAAQSNPANASGNHNVMAEFQPVKMNPNNVSWVHNPPLQSMNRQQFTGKSWSKFKCHLSGTTSNF